MNAGKLKLTNKKSPHSRTKVIELCTCIFKLATCSSQPTMVFDREPITNTEF